MDERVRQEVEPEGLVQQIARLQLREGDALVLTVPEFVTPLQVRQLQEYAATALMPIWLGPVLVVPESTKFLVVETGKKLVDISEVLRLVGTEGA